MLDDVAVRLLLIADTHIPRRARALPAQVWAEVARVELSGARIAMTREAGAAAGWETRVAAVELVPVNRTP
ncbi:MULTISPECIES: hypothetical protein [Micrococcus]|uniref:hypothetical protein n=1 Tax=Micrococcus luteus TaxID=1270 RepID=UPI0004E2ECA3|nr:hypothetical protein [Micrococcus luteus]KFC52490.1 hypothetical protein GY12_04530 [Micrococcus luteus]MBY0207311.1 hypothetical protein [Micrococcus luteus]